MESIKMSLKDVLSTFDKVIIPDVQRDYVMGSGGKKFTDLLTAMAESAVKDKRFNFSCLVGYKDKNNFYVYDGQQRLATLVFLCAHLKESTDTVRTTQELLKKFSFTGRDLANSWLEKPKEIKVDKAVDFTTYSLAKLIEEFTQIQPPYYNYRPSDRISFDFLFNKVLFDMIFIDEICDAEQFFLDINDGLDLRSYEVFKAELFHHASNNVLTRDSFKRFALKMENDWLRFFLPYLHKKSKSMPGNNTEVIAHCEEELLIGFLQYCFRMMWIEEKDSEEGYESTTVSWLTQEHLMRLECIVDAVVNEMGNASLSSLSCINYSLKHDAYRKGHHWNISDINYIAMLEEFLCNVSNSNETKKDVVIWCYIANLPYVGQTRDALYAYLRLVKKILNNNRKLCDSAMIKWGGLRPEHNYILHAGYNVQGIPQYYTQCENEECSDDTRSLLNSIISLNKGFIPNANMLCANDCIQACKNNLCKSILLKETKKEKSSDRNTIEQYENLPFINGLVDNFLNYTEDACQLKEFCNDALYSKLSDIQRHDLQYQYKHIVQFFYENKVSIGEILFSNIHISWENYCGTTHKKHQVSLVPHTWCDFFTFDNGIPFSETPRDYPLHILPDGWISADGKITQPEETDVENKDGFAAYAKTHAVWDTSNFLGNFSYILLNAENGLIGNGININSLPTYLDNYNSKNWIFNWLSQETKVYFSDKPYLNRILLYKFKLFMESDEKGKQDMTIYLKENKEKMRFIDINGNRFFIKLDEIQ
ncbi:DUF262 domain-containing protein [Paenibacillus hexagrammi]|uniref:DUF262 domain-containing protein n=1 Tax=Paenibacillus hexagrammi TaxID=2908839 RepID=A0ABY3SKI6_9BACL|nr:DUF262 domain-containing protein [Paenibacillus sp. YPD9-1]UJF33744.1 DUF262 domain-containing protein [Paenibacillus sp. YPD9-1]